MDAKLSKKERKAAKKQRRGERLVERSSDLPLMSPARERTFLATRETSVSHLQTMSRPGEGVSSVPLHPGVHPAFCRLALMYSERRIFGSTARCKALAEALKEFVRDFHTPSGKEFKREFNAQLTLQIDHVNKVRPKSVGMGNLLKHLKLWPEKLSANMSEDEMKESLVGVLDDYVEARILVPGDTIAENGAARIKDNDVVLTFGHSSVVKHVLEYAHNHHVSFSVVVIDSRPYFEGRRMTRELVACGIPCTYALVSGISHVLPRASLVFLGAHALLYNGALVARAGSAVVAMMANHFHKPVVVCAESFKFSDLSSLNHLSVNELGHQDELMSSRKGEPVDLTRMSKVDVRNLVYDLAPAEHIDMVVCEWGCIPPTSIPAVFRELSKDQMG
eukprot:TRINITY_DN80991_c0_g1_i1.p1 TRINITY_DN80991_c0_g1~~TRINITY_DN80991_c0_g1_i1.p1  ORF type:complete len:391 (+),score=84.91 TRINITY_DN80991_c0_g1_i1:228-1400(+)